MLAGLRVVDLSTEIAGPYCTKLLTDAGAETVKVEPPGGDPMRSWLSGALFEFLHTSQRSVVGGPEDATVRDLLTSADVIVEDGPAGSFDVAAVHAANPSAVVVSITPYGQDGPWRDRAATEFTLQACCGSTGFRGVPERPPVAAGGRIGEWVAGTYAAVAAIAAWRTALLSGQGEHVDVALLDSMALTMNTYTSVFAEFLDWPPLRRPTRTIEIPSIEPSKDGYAAFTTNSAQQFADFLILIGRPDLQEDKELSSALDAVQAPRRDAAGHLRAHRALHDGRAARAGGGAADPERPGRQRRHGDGLRPLRGGRHVRREPVRAVRAATGPVPHLGTRGAPDDRLTRARRRRGEHRVVSAPPRAVR